MKTISQTDLSQLIAAKGDHLVSMYMPLNSGVESRQNPVRVKKLLREAEDKLADSGADRADIERRLAQVRHVEDQTIFTDDIGQGLAVLIGDDNTWVRHLPVRCEELCVVGGYFHVLPLVAWLANDAPFYVLAVSQNAVRLLRGRRGAIEEITVPGLPADLHEVLRFDDAEPGLQAHAGQAGREGMVFHGHGGIPDAAKPQIVEFCREVDRAVSALLRQQREPLIFAGVDFLFSIYRDVNNYAHLLPEAIVGNPELWSAADMRGRAWPIIESGLRKRREDELRRYGNSIPLDRASDHIEDIILAAHAGAVGTLFIDPSARCTGHFDSDRPMVRVDDDAPHGDSEDLVNLATVLVLGSSGKVELASAADLPGDGAMAAIMRYPISPILEAVRAGASL